MKNKWLKNQNALVKEMMNLTECINISVSSDLLRINLYFSFIEFSQLYTNVPVPVPSPTRICPLKLNYFPAIHDILLGARAVVVYNDSAQSLLLYTDFLSVC